LDACQTNIRPAPAPFSPAQHATPQAPADAARRSLLKFKEYIKFKEWYKNLRNGTKIEELYQREELIWGEIRGPFGDFERIFRLRFGWFFALVFDRHFHGSFSVGDRPGNCLFHWVFWELAPFFEDSSNSASKVDFIQCPPC
jgi:hypothetical protein